MQNRVTQTRRRWLGTCGVAVGGMVVSGCMGGDGEEPGEDERDENPDPDSWPMHGFDPQNTGHHPTTTGPKSEVEVKWSFEAEASINSSPIVADGAVFVGTQDDYTYALEEETGDIYWQVETGGSHTPAISDGIVLAGHLYGLSVETGDEEWSRDKTVSELVISDGTAYSTHRFSVSSHYVSDGKQSKLIELDLDNRRTAASPVVDDGTVFTSAGQYFRGYNGETGSMVWETESHNGADMSAIMPSVGDEIIVAGDTDGFFYGLDLETGEIHWRNEHRPGTDRRAAIANGRVYVGDGQSIVVLDSESGTINQEIDLEGSVTRTDPVLVDDVLYIKELGRITAYDIESGGRLWSFDGEDNMATSPTVVDGVVYAASIDNTLYALEEA